VIIEEIISLMVHEEGEDYVAGAPAMISATAPRKNMKFRCRADILLYVVPPGENKKTGATPLRDAQAPSVRKSSTRNA
jgi:hypothetical protein